jgi:hypothetical protein
MKGKKRAKGQKGKVKKQGFQNCSGKKLKNIKKNMSIFSKTDF